jgi:hypothetical protein
MASAMEEDCGGLFFLFSSLVGAAMVCGEETLAIIISVLVALLLPLRAFLTLLISALSIRE